LHSVHYYDITKDKNIQGIMHRDLKPDNCLVDRNYTLKVADFGEARAFNENNTMTQVGTPLFIAPEIVRGDHYDTHADVFSFALTMLAWGLKGREKLTAFLFRVLLTEQGRKVNTALPPRQTIGRVSHALVSRG